MKTIEETKKWLLENRVNKYGDLDLSGLDFSDFDGNVSIGHMKVKNNLVQNYQEVGLSLFQDGQKVKDSFFDHKLKDDEEWKAHDNFVVRGKKLEEISRKELEDMGYKLKE